MDQIQPKTPSRSPSPGRALLASIGITFIYGFIALNLSDLGKYGPLGFPAAGIGFIGICFFFSVITGTISFAPFSFGKYNRRMWWIVAGWIILSLIYLSVSVLHGNYQDSPIG